MQEFLDTIVPVYVLKLNFHFFFFFILQSSLQSIPDLVPGYCADVICSFILKSAFFIIFNLPYGSKCKIFYQAY